MRLPLSMDCECDAMRHRFHSLCPYFAMFPEAFPEAWIDRLTKPGDVVADPFCGRGTTPFQAALMGRNAVASDVNNVAVCLTQAKCRAVSLRTLLARLNDLGDRFDGRTVWQQAKNLPSFFQSCFSRRTLQQLVFLREQLDWMRRRTDCVIAALVLGALHGDVRRSQAYLSNQMPRTISTKPAYSIRYWKRHGLTPPRRNVFEVVRNRAAFRYATPPPRTDVVVRRSDVRAFEEVVGGKDIRLIVTSPPYLDVTDFREDQWLRLWFLGGQPFPVKRGVSDDRHRTQDRYWSFIADAWRAMGSSVGRKGNVVLRIGARRLTLRRLVRAVEGASQLAGRRVRLIEVQESDLVGRQTNSFRPGSIGCKAEVDMHFLFDGRK